MPALEINTALIVMGIIAVTYTAIGGLKAVIYTDTFQWAILMAGLIFIGIPMAYFAVGGMDSIRASVSPEMLSMQNITWKQLLNWGVTIIPIWFVGMTLYQRIYAARGEREAKKAWFVAGFFEWPIMAFMGVSLGLLARVAVDQGMFADLGYATAEGMDAEMGLPMLLSTILPVGLMGLMMSAYFSAILSTADSCLMAASGNLQTDLLGKYFLKKARQNGEPSNAKSSLRISQVLTFVLGGLALLIAWQMTNVLDLMLHSYAFMVSGLFIPVLGGLFWKNSSPVAAFWSMLTGGAITFALILSGNQLPLNITLPEGIDANLYGITASLIMFVVLNLAMGKPLTLNKLNTSK